MTKFPVRLKKSKTVLFSISNNKKDISPLALAFSVGGLSIDVIKFKFAVKSKEKVVPACILKLPII